MLNIEKLEDVNCVNLLTVLIPRRLLVEIKHSVASHLVVPEHVADLETTITVPRTLELTEAVVSDGDLDATLVEKCDVVEVVEVRELDSVVVERRLRHMGLPWAGRRRGTDGAS